MITKITREVGDNNLLLFVWAFRNNYPSWRTIPAVISLESCVIIQIQIELTEKKFNKHRRLCQYHIQWVEDEINVPIALSAFRDNITFSENAVSTVNQWDKTIDDRSTNHNRRQIGWALAVCTAMKQAKNCYDYSDRLFCVLDFTNSLKDDRTLFNIIAL